MKQLLFTAEEKFVLEHVLNQRLNYYDTECLSKKQTKQFLNFYVTPVHSALNKISQENFFTKWEKLACNSCVNEYLSGEQFLNNNEIQIGKSILTKCDYFRKKIYH
jgi:hypothetical protein